MRAVVGSMKDAAVPMTVAFQYSIRDAAINCLDESMTLAWNSFNTLLEMHVAPQFAAQVWKESFNTLLEMQQLSPQLLPEAAGLGLSILY